MSNLENWENRQGKPQWKTREWGKGQARNKHWLNIKDSETNMFVVSLHCFIDGKFSGCCWYSSMTTLYGMLLQWNLSNPTNQETKEMCQILQVVGILINRNTLGP